MTNEEALQDWFKNNYPNDSFDDHKFYLIHRGWQAAIAHIEQEQSEPVTYLKFYSYESGLDRQEGFEEVSKHTEGAFPVFTTPQRQQPLKRLSDEVIDSLAKKGESWNEHGGWYFDADKFANAIMDEMQELNK